jgi:polysaccharide export outer membrane protein
MKRMSQGLVGAALVAILSWMPAAAAEDYIIGKEDVLQISVWLHSDLDKQVTVGNNGSIVFPPLGEVPATGLTLKQLGDRLTERITSFLRQTSSVTVTVIEYRSKSVFVSGAVARPGRYGAETMPSLIDVISLAGGASPGADLTQVEIIRKVGEGPEHKTIYADVASSLRNGVGVPLPDLMPGDAIVVPGIAAPGTSAAGLGVGILGEVNKPGLYPVGPGQDLWSAIAAAGGATALGNLKKVHVITPQGGGGAPVVATLNLKDSLKRGGRAPFIVKPGDVVYVTSTRETVPGFAWAGVKEVLAASRDILNLIVIADYLNTHHN